MSETDESIGPGSAGAAAKPVALARWLADPITLTLVYLVIVSAVLVAFPQIDIGMAGLFRTADGGFALSHVNGLVLLRQAGILALALLGLTPLLVLILKLARPQSPCLWPPSSMIFLALSLLVGPGLIVNLWLKPEFGRARPVDVTQFGGNLHFTRLWEVSTACTDNCSFPSGEGSSAVWLMALAFIVPLRWRVPTLVVTGGFAFALSLNRMAFGGHFLSDVLVAWGLTFLTILVINRFVLVRPPAWLKDEILERRLSEAGHWLRAPFRRRGGID